MISSRRWVALVGIVVVLALLCLVSIAVGARSMPLGHVLDALFTPDRAPDDELAIVRGLRVPRTVLGLLTGASIGLAGALMQGLTRNPLADPGLLGVSAGASLGIVAAIGILHIGDFYGYIWFAILGAVLASALVYVLGGLGQGGATPVKLALAGVGVTFFLGSVTSAIVLASPAALNRFRFWSAGSLAGQDTGTIWRVAPFLVVGIVIALCSAPALNTLALGDRMARALGRRVGLVRITGAVAVTLLAAASVAVTGPIVFVGLVVPHVVRLLTGPDYRLLLPFTLVLSPVLLLAADVLGRVVVRPGEMQVGVIVAFIGAPFFIALVRRRSVAEL
ncbi:FecCD family ABC transporter permease [Cryptosporangium arvum]|uniref:ABC-type Fe3+-siderophore transport system, permease component n=1 Tax=Cryptosporangium arvum DSM 44712 TaxID=927661 RepID=A0A011AI38_9ACTN|nr:iron chelate uptake ABC transporter family permease subunit [Cryptosporangium arvum]EXG81666.1 ABC-type Fe3+-siderophore transport system, permease component [Cryptosporangium arvum DSM 44712]